MNTTVVMRFLISFLLPCLWLLCGATTPPACGVPVIYDPFAMLPDFGATIFNCSAHAASVLNAPSYFVNQPTTVLQAQFMLNNLINVDSLQQTVTFDTRFRLIWTDNRFNLPNLFAVLNTHDVSNGIEIDELVNNQGLNIWMPNIHFIDAQSVNVYAESIRIKPNGVIYWSRHMVLTVTQEQLDFADYPMDTQVFNIRFEPYSLPVSMAEIGWQSPPYILYSNGKSYDFENNAMWTYISTSNSTEVVNYGTSDKPYWNSVGVLTFTFKRLPQGILVRLAVPITLLVLLAGLSFWAAKEDRVNVTITILLAVSALYIIIFSSVPMLGYLTYFDYYCLSMYTMLFAICFLHQFVYRLYDRQGKEGKHYQLQRSIIRGLEVTGRIGVIPTVLIVYLILFGYAYSLPSCIFLIMCILIYMGGITMYEIPGKLDVLLSCVDHMCIYV